MSVALQLVAAAAGGAAQHVVVQGAVDRDGARQIDVLIRDSAPEPPLPVIVDISRVEEINGALIGALLRVSRRLAWRNRQLTIVCADREHRHRLEVAGLDELADVIARLEPG